MPAGNTVLANVYGRTAAGKMIPLLVGPSGTLSLASQVKLIEDWTALSDLVATTPLLPFTPYGDTCESLLFGMKCLTGSAIGARFTVETSEDGVAPAKSVSYLYALAPGEQDVFESNYPLLRRYFRLSVAPLRNGGPIAVAFMVRGLLR